MSEEKGNKILLICMVVILVSVFIDFLLLPSPDFFITYALLLSLFFSLTYRGNNWARVCLSVVLLLSGLVELLGGIEIFSVYHQLTGIIIDRFAGIPIAGMGLLKLLIGFFLLFNRSVKALAGKRKPSR